MGRSLKKLWKLDSLKSIRVEETDLCLSALFLIGNPQAAAFRPSKVLSQAWRVSGDFGKCRVRDMTLYSRSNQN